MDLKHNGLFPQETDSYAANINDLQTKQEMIKYLYQVAWTRYEKTD